MPYKVTCLVAYLPKTKQIFLGKNRLHRCEINLHEKISARENLDGDTLHGKQAPNLISNQMTEVFFLPTEFLLDPIRN